MAEGTESKKDSTVRGLMVALVVAAVLGGLYGIFQAVDSGFERLRAQIETTNRENSMQFRAIRDMTKMILDHERDEAAAPAAAPAPAPAPAPEPAATPAPTQAAPAPTKAPPAE